METRWITYICPNNHRLIFGHSVSKRGKVQSPSPTVCSMGQTFIFAMFTPEGPRIDLLGGDTPFLSSLAS